VDKRVKDVIEEVTEESELGTDSAGQLSKSQAQSPVTLRSGSSLTRQKRAVTNNH